MTLTGAASGSTTTDPSGNYAFNNLAGGNYTVTPSRAGLLPGNTSINTTDVLAVQGQVLARPPLLTGCRLAAADVNASGTVNTVDVIAIQAFFLARTAGTANVGHFSFNPASRAYTPLNSNQTAQNYDGVCFGNVVSTVTRPDGGGDTEVARQATVASVTLPQVTIERSKTNLIAPVNTSEIDPSSNIVGFQGDFTFDERVVTFDSNPVQPAGLTASNWNVSGNILPGNGPIRTLRISAFSYDFAPLSGSGTLFELKINRVGQGSTQLAWAHSPNQFIFIDADLNTNAVGNTAPGQIRIQPSQR